MPRHAAAASSAAEGVIAEATAADAIGGRRQAGSKSGRAIPGTRLGVMAAVPAGLSTIVYVWQTEVDGLEWGEFIDAGNT